MAEKKGVRARLFGGKQDRPEDQRRRERELQERDKVDKKSLFKRVMRSDENKTSEKSKMTRDEEERLKRKQAVKDGAFKAMDTYDRHTDPKRKEADAKARHQQEETTDRRGGGQEKKPGKLQSAWKVGKFLHKQGK